MLAWSVAAMDEYANDGFPRGLLPPPAEPKCVCLLMMSTGVRAVSESSARGEVSASKVSTEGSGAGPGLTGGVAYPLARRLECRPSRAA